MGANESIGDFLGDFNSGFQDSFDQGGPLDPNYILPSEVETPRPRNEQVFIRLMKLSINCKHQFDNRYFIYFEDLSENRFSDEDIQIGVESGFLELVHNSLYEFDANKDPRKVDERTVEWVKRLSSKEQ